MPDNLAIRVSSAHTLAYQALGLLTDALVEARTDEPDACARNLNRAMAALREAAGEIDRARVMAEAPRRAREIDHLPTLETLLKDIARAGAGR